MHVTLVCTCVCMHVGVCMHAIIYVYTYVFMHLCLYPYTIGVLKYVYVCVLFSAIDMYSTLAYLSVFEFSCM